MTDNQAVEETSLFEYKFFVCLSEISLKNQKPVECIIKFKYELFGPEEREYPSFTIHPNSSLMGQISHKIYFFPQFFSKILKYLFQNV